MNAIYKNKRVISIALAIVVLALSVYAPSRNWILLKAGFWHRYDEDIDAGVEEDGTYVIDSADMVDGASIIRDISRSELSDAERNGLAQMRDEEKLARDVYLALGLRWTAHIFENIAGSEQSHTNSVRLLIDRYGMADPVFDDSVGVFASPDMQKLHKDFIAEGEISLLDAFKAGAAVEELDIRDLNNLLAETDNEDIKAVYADLRKGSRNHLRAFSRQIHLLGGSYEPRYISQKEYHEIVSSPQEKGRAK